MGASFLEGQWVGFYLSSSGEARLIREFIRQDWASIYIEGQAFDNQGNPWGQWHSVHALIEREGLLRVTMMGNLVSGHYDSWIDYQLEGNPPRLRSGRIIDLVSNPHAGSTWMRLKKLNDADVEEPEALREALEFRREFP